MIIACISCPDVDGPFAITDSGDYQCEPCWDEQQRLR